MNSMTKKPNKDWLPAVRPVVIAGPCSAESRGQVLTTARLLKEEGQADFFRAGLWKPRTLPGSFQGVGDKGVQWLKEAETETGIPVITEVANARHVGICLENGINNLWIGARTTVSPFTVQEIADALKGSSASVFVKNPLSPDINLWRGGIERILNAGINKIAAIHRGFSSSSSGSRFRNDPLWEMPIELKLIFPDLPVFCDPSHISGKREYLKEVAQKAMDLNMDGLMIESHYAPEEALSDKEQQIKPASLAKMIGSLHVRNTNVHSPEFNNLLEELRDAIDEVDEDMLYLISKRMQLIEKIGEYKKDNNVTILQLKRWEEILSRRSSLGGAIGLSDDFLYKMLNLIHQESIRIQTEIMNEKKEKEKLDSAD